jgi:hypothetical protein
MIKENKDMNNEQIPDKFSLEGIEPYMLQVSNLNKPLLTIHGDGRITVSEDCKPTETAAEVLQIMRDQWLSDIQCAKIRELQSDVNELKELVEYLQDRIKKLKKAGDDLDSWLGRETPVTVRINWRQVKGVKP